MEKRADWLTKSKFGHIVLLLAILLIAIYCASPGFNSIDRQHREQPDNNRRISSEYKKERTHPLASLEYSSIFGGEMNDYAVDVVCDDAGNICITGYTYSSAFPCDGYGEDDLRQSSDCFVTKFSPKGNVILYSAIFGGSGADMPYAIDIDSEGNTYIVGRTTSDDFPMVNSYDASFGGGSDGFLVKLDSEGDEILYSTYLGASNWDRAADIAVESPESICIIGSTESYEFPTTSGAFDETYNADGDGFVLKLDPSSNTLLFSSFFGGFETDDLYSVDLDSSGNVYVAGETESENLPTTPGAFDRSYNGGYLDSFVFKLSNNGSSLIFASYYGGAGTDLVNAILVNSEEEIILAGSSTSADILGIYANSDEIRNSYETYVLKLASQGDEYEYLKQRYASNDDYSYDMALCPDESVIVVGRTYSEDFHPSSAALDMPDINHYSNGFAFKVTFDPDEVGYCTHIGGKNTDTASGVAVDSEGHVIIVGYTRSSDFPTHDGYTDTSTGEQNCFLLSLPDLTDSDYDGLTDLEESALGTNIHDYDTDGDNFSDYWEVHNGYDPLDPAMPREEYLAALYGTTLVVILVICVVCAFRNRIGNALRSILVKKPEFLLYECSKCKTRFEAPTYGRGSRKRECPECGTRALPVTSPSSITISDPPITSTSPSTVPRTSRSPPLTTTFPLTSSSSSIVMSPL